MICIIGGPNSHWQRWGDKLDGVREGDLAGEVVEEGLAIRGSVTTMEGGRPEVVGALEVVMADKEEQSFEGVEVALPRAV